jgi:hypothetical protein
MLDEVKFMAIALTKPKVVRVGNALLLFGTLVATVNYGAPDTLDLSSIPGLPTDVVPDYADINSAKNLPSGYIYQYVPGATLATCKVAVSQSGGAAAPNADIGAGAYPAGVLADVISALFIFTNFGS